MLLGKHRATLNPNHCYEILKGLKKEMQKEKEYHKVSHEIERHIRACGHKGIAEYFKKLNEEHSHVNEKYEKYLCCRLYVNENSLSRLSA